MNFPLPDMKGKLKIGKRGLKLTVRNLQKKISIYPKRIKRIILKTLSCERIKKPGEITVCFVNDSQIKEFNLKFLQKNYATDVLCFNLATNPKEFLGDIVISVDTAVRNAKIFKTQPLYEICLYIVHGLLHLLGYEDKNSRLRRIMQNREREILKCLSIRLRQ